MGLCFHFVSATVIRCDMTHVSADGPSRRCPLSLCQADAASCPVKSRRGNILVFASPVVSVAGTLRCGDSGPGHAAPGCGRGLEDSIHDTGGGQCNRPNRKAPCKGSILSFPKFCACVSGKYPNATFLPQDLFPVTGTRPFQRSLCSAGAGSGRVNVLPARPSSLEGERV